MAKGGDASTAAPEGNGCFGFLKRRKDAHVELTLMAGGKVGIKTGSTIEG